MLSPDSLDFSEEDIRKIEKEFCRLKNYYVISEFIPLYDEYFTDFLYRVKEVNEHDFSKYTCSLDDIMLS